MIFRKYYFRQSHYSPLPSRPSAAAPCDNTTASAAAAVGNIAASLQLGLAIRTDERSSSERNSLSRHPHRIVAVIQEVHVRGRARRREEVFERLRKVRGFTQSLHGPFNMEHWGRKGRKRAMMRRRHGLLDALDKCIALHSAVAAETTEIL